MYLSSKTVLGTLTGNVHKKFKKGGILETFTIIINSMHFHFGFFFFALFFMDWQLSGSFFQSFVGLGHNPSYIKISPEQIKKNIDHYLYQKCTEYPPDPQQI